MTDFILPRLPKSLQGMYIEYGRNALLGLIAVICAVVFIALYERSADKVEAYSMLEVTAVTQEIGNNRSPETVYTVRTPEGTEQLIRTQSPAVIRDTGATICAELLRSSDGSARWEATPSSACK